MFKAVVGHSEDVDGAAAAAELIASCEPQLSGGPPRGGILFASIDSEHQVLLDAIHDTWPDIALIGCTTDGELSSGVGFAEDSATLILFDADSAEMHVGVGREVSQDIEGACKTAVEEAVGATSEPPRLCLALPESLTASGHAVVTSLGKALGDGIPVFGALASDQWRFQGTKQFAGREVLSDSLPLMVLSGEVDYSFGIGSGWSAVGESGEVTRAEGPNVFEIDGAPITEFYSKYFGEGARPAPECPLVVFDEQGDVDYLRAPTGVVDEATGAVSFFGDVPSGARVQLAVTGRDELLSGCRGAVEDARKAFPDGRTPGTAIIFSCASRKLLLGTKIGEEATILNTALGDDLSFAGFYCYGEIAPRSTAHAAGFHNYTFVFLLLG